MRTPSGPGLEFPREERYVRLLKGKRVGLVAHPASVNSDLRHAAEILATMPGVTLAVVFGPEHGLLGEAQDLVGVKATDDPLSGVRGYSLYGDSVENLRPTAEQLAGLDVVVIDLQDVGARYYTFQATMLYCMEAAANVGLPVIVLDRPNPLGGVIVEGPALRAGYESFIGCHDIAIRHGLTIGELARLYRAERRIDVELDIFPCRAWRRDTDFEIHWLFDLPWVMPSPNMPTVDTAFVYPGMCLIEGTALSEGRGTTRPFELCGFPGIDARKLAARLNSEGLNGVRFRPAWFEPTFQKHKGVLCAGVQLHVQNRDTFQPVRTGLAVLAALRDAAGDRFAWRTEEYEFVRDPIAIDLLFGSDRERLALESGADWREIAAEWENEERAFRERRQPHLLYT